MTGPGLGAGGGDLDHPQRSDDDSLVGSLFAGRFRVEALLGRGGMGSVYRVRHEILQRLFALKVIRKDLLSDETIAARFRREARAASRIDHPNMIRIFDFGQAEDGRLYLAMEHIEGPTLSEVLAADGPFPVPRALWILAQIADALDAAHSSNVIHRDLKPINILVTESRVMPDQVKILDFGLAKIVDMQATAGLSVHGKVFGTPEYISPERCMDQPADHRTDIYSLGIITFELLVGRPPFAGKVVQTLAAHIKEQPPAPSAASGRGDIPPQLDQLVLRCLAKRPEDRYQTSAELAGAVQELRSAMGLDPAATLRLARSQVHRQSPAGPDDDQITLPVEDLRAEVGSGSDTTTFDSPRLFARGDAAAASLQPLEDLAYALRDRGVGTPQITHELGLLIEVKDLHFHASSTLAALEEQRGDAQMTARIRESHLTQALNQLEHEILLLGESSPQVTRQLRLRVEALTARIQLIGAELERGEAELRMQMARHREALPELRQTLERRAESLRALLRRMGPLIERTTDHEIRTLVASARL